MNKQETLDRLVQRDRNGMGFPGNFQPTVVTSMGNKSIVKWYTNS